MKTCETCKHWTKYAELTTGLCSGIVLFKNGEQQPAAVLSKDEEAGVMTMPTFGCTLHEEKEQKKPFDGTYPLPAERTADYRTKGSGL